MTFLKYLEKHGPSIKEFAEMQTQNRPGMLQTAYALYLDLEYGRTINTQEMLAVIAGFEVATELMVWQHMAQQARELAELEKLYRPNIHLLRAEKMR